MDDITLSASDFLNPILKSYAANDLERAMAGVFTSLIQDQHINELNDILNYGTPWQGSRTVVERFTKLNGLTVLRRDDGGLSDTLMSLIYANWSALASERGIQFLQFVLNMLYPDQNSIVQLWHSKELANSYPLYATEISGEDRFLTSRIRIKIDSSVDVGELSELSPTIAKLVPWHIVPEVAVTIDTQDLGMHMAIAAQGYNVANFSPY